MATLNRRPLTHRSLQHPPPFSPLKSARAFSASKRPRSPDPSLDPSISQQSSKRIKAIAPSPAIVRDKTRERKHTEREQQKAEFKDKYTRAFPTFTFYFEEDVALDTYEDMIEQLGGVRMSPFDLILSPESMRSSENNQIF